jgi:hypothetical protein
LLIVTFCSTELWQALINIPNHPAVTTICWKSSFSFKRTPGRALTGSGQTHTFMVYGLLLPNYFPNGSCQFTRTRQSIVFKVCFESYLKTRFTMEPGVLITCVPVTSQEVFGEAAALGATH